jgi:hypothetical protein
MVGEEEIASGAVRIKLLVLGEKSSGDKVERGEMVEFIMGLLHKAQV